MGWWPATGGICAEVSTELTSGEKVLTPRSYSDLLVSFPALNHWYGGVCLWKGYNHEWRKVEQAQK
jgi:hypothetical protein